MEKHVAPVKVQHLDWQRGVQVPGQVDQSIMRQLVCKDQGSLEASRYRNEDQNEEGQEEDGRMGGVGGREQGSRGGNGMDGK